MSDQPNQSPVVAPVSPIGQGWHYMSAARKGTVLVAVGGAVFIGSMVLSGRIHTARNVKPEPQPVAQDTVIDPLKLPPAPTIQPTPAVAALPMPVAAPMVGPRNFIKPQNNNLDDWSIMAISSGGGSIGQPNNNTGRATEEANGQQSELSARLTPTPLIGTNAVELPDPEFLISQGRQIPCAQQSAINTSYPGGVSATIPVDVRGDTGHVVLLNAGSKIFGTIEHGITNGLDRVFVLWHRVTTPPLYDGSGRAHEYAIQVNSPAADEAGSTGVELDVNRHIPQKFGGVFALSVLEGGMSILSSALQSSHSTNINLGNFTSGGSSLASILLQSTIQIPDVGTRPQGSSCTLFVSRDLNFGNVFSVRQRYAR